MSWATNSCCSSPEKTTSQQFFRKLGIDEMSTGNSSTSIQVSLSQIVERQDKQPVSPIAAAKTLNNSAVQPVSPTAAAKCGTVSFGISANSVTMVPSAEERQTGEPPS